MRGFTEGLVAVIYLAVICFVLVPLEIAREALSPSRGKKGPL